MTTTEALALVKAERCKQDQKWGRQSHSPYKWLAILGEEVGESCQAVLEGDLTDYRKELVQVAAVACAALECLDTEGWMIESLVDYQLEQKAKQDAAPGDKETEGEG